MPSVFTLAGHREARDPDLGGFDAHRECKRVPIGKRGKFSIVTCKVRGRWRFQKGTTRRE